MRVLQVVPRISPQSGGPSVALPGLARALVQNGVATTLLTTNVAPNGRLDVPLTGPTVRDGVDYVFHHVWAGGGRYGFAPSLVPSLRHRVREYDLVHIHWLYDFACIVAARAARAARVPFVVQPAGSLDPHLSRKNAWIKRTYLATVGRPLLADAAAIIFTSEQERRLAADETNGSAWVIPVGLDAATFSCLPATGTFRRHVPDIDGPFLLFVGRLSRQKGLDLLIRAFARLASRRPELWLVLAGPDPDGYGTRLRRLSEDLGVGHRLRFTGLLSHDLKLAAYRDADLFVLSSYAENFGAVVTEALACGLPVVISDQVNIHVELAAAGAATVVRCEVDHVAAGIESALSDPTLRARMSTLGPALVAARYTWDVIAPMLITRYREVLHG